MYNVKIGTLSILHGKDFCWQTHTEPAFKYT